MSCTRLSRNALAKSFEVNLETPLFSIPSLWAGAPYKIYGGRKGQNDYADDINTRSLMTNWLGGGSVYMPALNGKNVPLELSLALHSDAGFNPDGKSTWGALAICTTDFNDGMLNSGVSRFTSKDFAKALRDNLVEDMGQTFGAFGKRYLWDRNYSETRLPEVPSAILEMLSHQSFPDMRIAQDPMGKFTIARSIYKTILRFVNSNHGEDYVVQPLAPNHFSVEIGDFGYNSREKSFNELFLSGLNKAELIILSQMAISKEAVMIFHKELGYLLNDSASIRSN